MILFFRCDWKQKAESLLGQLNIDAIHYHTSATGVRWRKKTD